MKTLLHRKGHKKHSAARISPRTAFNRVTAGILYASILITTNPANAGFLDDFYNSAGATVNATAPAIYQTQSMSTVTGGSLVWKTPQRNFTPLFFTPPSLSAGCGGIDVFMGAFSLPSKEEFIQFLRNIGQNSAGLAFKVALHALSPDLETKIQEISEKIREYTQYFQNSCAAAKQLMDSGPGAWLNDAVASASGNQNLVGTYTDYGSSSEAHKSNGGRAIVNATWLKDTDGRTVDAPVMNVMWRVIQGNNKIANLDENEKEMIMALTGSVIFAATESGGGSADTVIAPVQVVPLMSIEDLLNPTTATISLKSWRCDEYKDCLMPQQTTISTKSFYGMVKTQIDRVRDNILNRTPTDPNDIRMLTAITSIPIYKIIATSTSRNNLAVSQTVLDTYAMAIATELATNYITDMSAMLAKQFQNLKMSSLNANRVHAFEATYEHVQSLTKNAESRRREVYEKLSSQLSAIQQVQAMEKAMYQNMTDNLAANVRFSTR